MTQRRVLGVLWLLLAVFLLAWAFRMKGQAMVITDTMEYVFPEKWVSVDLWRRGVVPLWNPYVACGTPHMANFQSACFYPPFWIWNATGLWDWFYYLVLAHVAWAVAGFFLWARSRSHHGLSCFLAALSFGLSSQATGLWGFPTHLATLSWVPWIFLAAGRFLERPSAGRWAAWTLCLVLQWTAGYLQIGAYTFLFMSLWIAWQRPPARVWLGWAAVSGTALAMTALQWIPTMDYLANSKRVPHLAHVYCLNWREVLQILHPTWVGFPGTEGYRGTLPNTVFLPGYVGWVVLLFLAGALLRLGRMKKDRFFAVGAVLVLLWAAGTHFPPWRWLLDRWVGILEPAKASFLWSFCACTAGAAAFSQVWMSLKRRRFGAAAAALLAVSLLADMAAVPSRCVRHQRDPLRDAEVTASMTQLARITGDGRMVSLRKKDGRAWSGRPGHAGFLWESAFQGFPNMNAVFGIRTAGAHLSTTPDGYQNILLYLQKGFPYEGRVLDAAAVRALVLPEHLTGIKYEVGMTRGGMLFHSNAGALPQAWRVSHVVEKEDRSAVLGELLSPGVFLEDRVFTEDAPGGRAVLLPPPSRTLRQASRPKNPWPERLKRFLRGEAPSHAFTDRAPSPSRALFEADFEKTGWMVFSETFFPGWRAWVDGVPVPIFRANGLFMAVPVRQGGIRQVQFRYEPVTFRLGLFMSLLAVTAFLCAQFMRVRRRETRG